MAIKSHQRISRSCVEYVDRIMKPVDRLLGQPTGLYLNLVSLLPFVAIVALAQATA